MADWIPRLLTLGFGALAGSACTMIAIALCLWQRDRSPAPYSPLRTDPVPGSGEDCAGQGASIWETTILESPFTGRPYASVRGPGRSAIGIWSPRECRLIWQGNAEDVPRAVRDAALAEVIQRIGVLA